MWQRFTLYDLRVIGHYLGILVLLSSVVLAVPFVLALVCGEWEAAARYFFTIGVSVFIGATLRLLRIDPGRLGRQQALAVTGFAWILLAAIGAIPLFLSGHFATYLDALFDAVSGYTASGVSIIGNLNHLSYADNMWRFAMHFFGGIGLVVVALSIGAFGRVSNSSLYSSEGRSEHVVPNVVQTARFILGFSLGVIAVFSVLVAFLFLWGGMEAPRAFLHGFWVSISAFMTAGFTPMSSSLGYYHSMPVDLLICLLMLAGGVNFGLYLEVFHGRTKSFFKDLEVRTGLVWLGIMVIIFAFAMSSSPLVSDLPVMLRRDVFIFISAATTTGYSTITPNQLANIIPSGAFLVLAAVMAVGASAGSTAGGIKLSRVGMIGKSIKETVKTTASPDSARVVAQYNHIGRRRLEPGVAKEAMTIFILFVITYALGSLVGIAYGYDAVDAIFESVAMASNGGLSSGICQQGMPVGLQLVYMFEMWAGRLEFVTLFALMVKIAVSCKPRLHLRKRSA